MFTQLIHMLWWLGSNVCVYVAVISVAVTFFDDYSCLSLLIYLKNALGLASENMKTKKKAVRRISTNDIDLKKNRLLPNVDNVEVHLDLFSGDPHGSQNDKKNMVPYKTKKNAIPWL